MMQENSETLSEVELFKYFSDLENALALEQGFFESLLKDDDWSFVIKLHALIEAATTHLLTEVIGKPELQTFITRIEMSNKSSGKLAMLKAMDLIDIDSQRYIIKLSELRNSFVHNITNASTSIDDFFASLEESDEKGFTKAFRWGLKAGQEFKPAFENDKVHVNELTKYMAISMFPLSKKACLWLGSAIIFQQVYRQVEIKKTEQAIEL